MPQIDTIYPKGVQFKSIVAKIACQVLSKQ